MKFEYTKADGEVSERHLEGLKVTAPSARAIDLSGVPAEDRQKVLDAINTWKKTVEKTINAAIKELKTKHQTLEQFVTEKTGYESAAWVKSFTPEGLKRVE